ncbi:hypothetical protein EDB89DRAFT_2024063 [Lactarius sanguifluus]|nr:hypothetical protein EDB89DRAFT_2024063 [Lactarius sanguifluus]
MLIVLGSGLSVLLRIIIGGSSTDHVRWGLGSVNSRIGMIGSSRQGTVLIIGFFRLVSMEVKLERILRGRPGSLLKGGSLCSSGDRSRRLDHWRDGR